MAFTLYVDTERWRAHQRSVLEEYPDLVPVAKGNGYGFDSVRLAREAARFGADLLAVGTAHEAGQVADDFGGDLMVLTPYRLDEPAVSLPDRVVRTVSTVEDARGLTGARVVVEVMSSVRRHGIAVDDLTALGAVLDDVRFEGFTIHLPLGHPHAADEVRQWMDRLGDAGLPLHTVFVSHVPADRLAELRQAYPRTRFRPRVGTRLWLGDRGAMEYRGAVLDVTRVARGERYGYWQRRAPSAGHLVVVSGGTTHGVGLEAPKMLRGVRARIKEITRAGHATANRHRSRFEWAGGLCRLAEPPHMHVSILFLPADVAPPARGDELRASLRFTTTRHDRLVDR